MRLALVGGEPPLSAASQEAVVDGVTGAIEDSCAEKHGFLVSGEGGSGKTHVAHALLQKVPRSEWRALVVTPTARLADVYGQRYHSELVVVDTVDAAYTTYLTRTPLVFASVHLVRCG